MRLRTSLLLVFVFLILALALGACGGASAPKDAAPDLSSLPVEITVDQAAALLDNPDVVFIDVREQDEYDAGHIPGVKLIPLGSIPGRLSEIPTDKTVVAVCRSGNRSGQATEYLRQQGFDKVHNMAGGMNQWSQAGYEVER